MADISFRPDGLAIFPTRYHGEVTLTRWKWEEICAERERFYYKHNGEKVATTLINPDIVRHHRIEPNQFFYYKEFETYKLDEGIEGPVRCKFFAVIVDVSTKRVCTLYPVIEPKEGKEYKGGES